jgi:hypothetical protein
MLKVTSSRPELVIPWIELGLAQLGLKQYDDAEKSFKIALGTDTKSQERSHSDDFYQSSNDPDAVAPTATTNPATPWVELSTAARPALPPFSPPPMPASGKFISTRERSRRPQVVFDTAVQSHPQQASLCLGNETIFFFQIGNAGSQLTAAEKAIAVDPKRAMLHYFKAQALTSKATVDPQTQKLVLPPRLRRGIPQISRTRTQRAVRRWREGCSRRRGSREAQVKAVAELQAHDPSRRGSWI